MKEHAKKALKHDFKVAGKTVPTIAVVALFLIGSGSAAVLTNFGTVGGTASVDQAIQVNDKNGQLDSTATLNTYDAGSYFRTNLDSNGDNTMTITSQSGSAVPVALETAYEEGDVDDPSNAAIDGVTAHNIVYNTPEESDYDVVVSNSSELEEALKNSTSKILVESGTYTLSGNKDLGLGASNTELVSAEGPEETTIGLDGVTLETSGDSFTVKGFEFTGSGNGQYGDGFIFHRPTDLTGTLTVEDNIFETDTSASDQREFRYVWAQDVGTVDVEDNFFTGNSDSGVEINAKNRDSQSDTADITVESNTFAGLADKGVALRAEDGYVSTLEIKNNNFVSNSDTAIEVNSVSNHAEITMESNYFNHTGAKVEENGLSPSYSLNAADNPQTDGEVTVPAGETLEVTQLTYLDVALSGTSSYSLQTSVNPAR